MNRPIESRRICSGVCRGKWLSFIFARASGDEAILCIFNPANRDESAAFDLNINAKKIEHLEGDELTLSQDGTHYTIDTPAVSYSFIKLTY